MLASAICLIYQNNFDVCRKNIEVILNLLVTDAFDNAVDIIKKFLIDIVKCIRQKSGEVYLKTTSLGEVLKQVTNMMEKEEIKKQEAFEENYEEKRKENDSNLLENSKRSGDNVNNASGGEEYEENLEENADYEEEEEIV